VDPLHAPRGGDLARSRAPSRQQTARRPSEAPAGRRTLVATGGSGTGYQWSILANASAGSIDASTGEYVSGSTGGVADVVQVVDSLGNTSTVQLAVAPWRLEGGGGCSSGGGDAFTLVLVGAAAMLRRRRLVGSGSIRAGVAALALLVATTVRAGGVTSERL